METDRYCNVCNDLASYFCRMCSTHYCAAHLCLHLSVAWESNSWTKRNEREIEDENKTIRTLSGSIERYGQCDEECESLQKIYVNNRMDISHNAKSVATYSQAQLQAQLQFYMSQARRIRAELERRAVSLESVEEIERRQFNFRANRNITSSQKLYSPKSTISRQFNKHTTVLSSSLRSGYISLEYIIAQINALAKKS